MTFAFSFEPRMPGDTVTVDTRAMANESVDRQKRYAQIKSCLAEYGPMTARELAVALWRKGLIPSAERNFTAPRLTEMCRSGVVEPKGKRVCEYTRHTVAVYGLLEEAHGD